MGESIMSVRFTIGRAVGLFGFVVTLGCVAILVANMIDRKSVV